MSDLQALAEALVFLEGQGSSISTDPQERAAILIAQLADRGYVVRAPAALPVSDSSPANLLATRRRLALRAEDVAQEAGVTVGTVRRAERADRRVQAANLQIIAAALTRLVAAKVERTAVIHTMVSISQELDLP